VKAIKGIKMAENPADKNRTLNK